NGTMDVIFGTLATFISVGAISLTAKYIKNKASLVIASLWPTIFNGIIIGWMLNVTVGAPLWLTMGEVALGEFVVITIVGIPIFKMIQNRYTRLLKEEF
ncbi:MAG: QueT transporter family protein, partial [Staphylococcus sp.]|nr:QueT transporter family protein [Staphylococcus sp.]